MEGLFAEGGSGFVLVFAGVAFFIFCIFMAMGHHFWPGGPLQRNPSRKGDLAIGFFAICCIMGIVYIASGGWRQFFDKNHAPPQIAQPLFTPALVEGGTVVSYIPPESLTKPVKVKEAARQYCMADVARRKAATPGSADPVLSGCNMFLWGDTRKMPRFLPIPSYALETMTATYRYNAVVNLDRFCWLESGKILEKNCF